MILASYSGIFNLVTVPNLVEFETIIFLFFFWPIWPKYFKGVCQNFKFNAIFYLTRYLLDNSRHFSFHVLAWTYSYYQQKNKLHPNFVLYFYCAGKLFNFRVCRLCNQPVAILSQSKTLDCSYGCFWTPTSKSERLRLRGRAVRARATDWCVDLQKWWSRTGNIHDIHEAHYVIFQNQN